jgi:hypothetical protein
VTYARSGADRLAQHPFLRAAILALIATLIGAAISQLVLGHAGGAALGALTLVESAKLDENMLRRGIIGTFVESSAVLSRLPFMEIEGNAYQYGAEATLPGVAFRAVNAAYTESTGTINNATEGLKILGGDADVDRFIQRTRSRTNDQLAFQMRLKAKATATVFTEYFFEGDTAVTVDGFDGLRKRLTGAQVILQAAGGGALTLSALDDMIAAVEGGPDVIYANDWLIRKINALVRATGMSTPEPRREYGRLVYQYAGVDLVDPGYSTNGTTRILGFDEDPGDAVLDTASVYAVKFGADEYVAGLTNGGLDAYIIGELETKPAVRGRIEWYVGLAVFRGRSAARIRGITQA